MQNLLEHQNQQEISKIVQCNLQNKKRWKKSYIFFWLFCLLIAAASTYNKSTSWLQFINACTFASFYVFFSGLIVYNFVLMIDSFLPKNIRKYYPLYIRLWVGCMVFSTITNYSKSTSWLDFVRGFVGAASVTFLVSIIIGRILLRNKHYKKSNQETNLIQEKIEVTNYYLEEKIWTDRFLHIFLRILAFAFILTVTLYIYNHQEGWGLISFSYAITVTTLLILGRKLNNPNIFWKVLLVLGILTILFISGIYDYHNKTTFLLGISILLLILSILLWIGSILIKNKRYVIPITLIFLGIFILVKIIKWMWFF